MSASSVIRFEEGWRPTVYSDTEGVATIGYGFNVDERGGGMPQKIGDIWLEDELIWRESDLRELFGPESWVMMGDARQAALISMHYQLGAAGFRSFERMIGAIKQGLWLTASRECLASKAAGQTPSRYGRNARALLTGEGQWT